ncbi:MAG TPA: trypsin-like peptidase domain-containing protein [Bryobacteraceae bacterium]|nr:trypsin-like peptidase domain-containing protein [Bryobacteraceae bacterium]
MKRHASVFFLLTLLSANAQNPTTPILLRDLSSSLEQLSNRVRGGVVQIFSTAYVANEENDSGNAALLSKQRSTGSGVLLTADGYIVTNAHVVRASRSIQVRMAATRHEFPGGASILAQSQLIDAKLVGLDRETDLAVIKIEGGQLPHLALGDSDQLRQGEVVMAFGNPLGLEGSVTLGIVSSIARQIKPEDPMVYIQTDAPINPGNSGGPLINAEGQVMGINSFILSQSGGSEGLGFAIPSNIVRNIYEQIRREGHVHRGQIGVSAQTISSNLAKGLSLRRDWGVVVSDVAPDGPAQAAGVQVGDIITAADGKLIDSTRRLQLTVYSHRKGDRIKLDLLRDQEVVHAEVPVTESPEDPERFADMVNPQENLVRRLGGVLCIPIDKKLAELLPDLRHEYGILVAAGSASEGLKTGDVIYAVNTEPVTTVAALRKMLDQFKDGDSPVFQIERDGHLMFVTIELE